MIVPRDVFKKITETPVNRRLMLGAIFAISFSVVLMLIMIIWIICMENIPYVAMLFLKGFAGLGAVIFLILYGWLLYRVNRKYIEGK